MATEAASAEASSSEGHEGHHGPSFLQHHFDTPAQQFDTAKLGMWAFLAQEILFFSGLFVAYGIFRAEHPEAFSVGSHLLNKELGALNTLVLLVSSFTVAMAVRSGQLGKRNHVSWYLATTIVLAGVFLVIKYFEYTHKIHVGLLPGEFFAPTGHGAEEIEAAMAASGHEVHHVPYHLRSFFGIYFMLTGVHGLHVLVGMFVLGVILVMNIRGKFDQHYFTPIDISGLYWHLVDLIWIYLFPLLYLID